LRVKTPHKAALHSEENGDPGQVLVSSPNSPADQALLKEYQAAKRRVHLNTVLGEWLSDIRRQRDRALLIFELVDHSYDISAIEEELELYRRVERAVRWKP
jgi:predicted DNA-binding protein (MmcQ/YjbR family)